MWILSKRPLRVQRLLVVVKQFRWGFHDARRLERAVARACSTTRMTDSKQPASPHRSRLRPLGAGLLAIAAVLTVGRAPPSQDYALCSLGSKIYTVDTAHPNVECIVVSNTTIADVGDLGGSLSFPFLCLLTGCHGAVDIKARWRRHHTWNFANFQIPSPLDFWQRSLPISFVEPNSIVVPGLTGRPLMCTGPSVTSTLDRRTWTRVAIRRCDEPGPCRLQVKTGYFFELLLRDPCSPSTEVLQRVVHYVKSHPDVLADPSRWVVGMGWDQNLWPDSQYPTAVCTFHLCWT